MVSKAMNGSTPGRDPSKGHFLPKKKCYYTRQQVKEALERNKGAHYATARDLDISPNTLYGYYVRWPGLKKIKKAVMGYRMDKLVDNAYSLAESGDKEMIKFVLDRRGGEAWRKKIVRTGKMEVEHKVVPVIKAELTEADRQKWLEEIRKQRALGHKKPLPPESIEQRIEDSSSSSQTPIIIEGKFTKSESSTQLLPVTESQVYDGSSQEPREESERGTEGERANNGA
jgi:hypothetical protein